MDDKNIVLNEELENYLADIKAYQEELNIRANEINRMLSSRLDDQEKYLESLIEDQAPKEIIEASMDAKQQELVTMTMEKYQELINAGRRLQNSPLLAQLSEEVRNSIKASIENTINKLKEVRDEIVAGIKTTVKTWKDNFRDNAKNLYNTSIKSITGGHIQDENNNRDRVERMLKSSIMKSNVESRGEEEVRKGLREFYEDKKRQPFIDMMDEKEANIRRRNEENKTASPLKRFFNDIQNHSDQRAIRSSAKTLSAIYNAERAVDRFEKNKQDVKEAVQQFKEELAETKEDGKEAIRETVAGIKDGIHKGSISLKMHLAETASKLIVPIYDLNQSMLKESTKEYESLNKDKENIVQLNDLREEKEEPDEHEINML